MGIGEAEAEFLTAAAQVGVSFETTLTLGRQSMGGRWAEPFLEGLGARAVRSMDATDYEDATDIHDLNDPVPADLEEQFSAVVDSGTIEHVFNAPEALRSAMRMTRVGGHVVMMTPCNDAPGHGFYQFTPELLYRVFSSENGYRVRRFMLHEQRGRWFDVADPAGARCEFRTDQTAYLFVIAERVEAVPIFARWPQQSDYTVHWDGGDGAGSTSRGARLVAKLPPRVRREVMRARARSWPPSYKRRRIFTPTRL